MAHVHKHRHNTNIIIKTQNCAQDICVHLKITANNEKSKMIIIFE